METFNSFLSSFGTSNLKYVLAALIIFAVGAAASKLLKSLVIRVFEKNSWQEELKSLCSKCVFWAVFIFSAAVSCIIILSNVFGFNVKIIEEYAVLFGTSILKTGLVLFLGNILIKIVIKILTQLLVISKIEPTLHSFILSASKIFLFIILIMISLDTLGIPTASLIASLASAGLAISLSIKDYLSNLIGGVVILLSHPFKEKDFVEIDGTEGLVSEIGLIYTVLKTFDNRTVLIPNNDTAKAKIVNHSSENVRRLDMIFSIGYSDDYEKAREIILKTANETGLCLSNPAPFARMKSHSASSIDISCRLWVKWENYFELSAQMNERVKKAFDENSINIPFNQLDVHIING